MVTVKSMNPKRSILPVSPCRNILAVLVSACHPAFSGCCITAVFTNYTVVCKQLFEPANTGGYAVPQFFFSI